MSVSVERLRRWLLVGVVLLVAVIAAFLGFARHAQHSLQQTIKKDLSKLGLDIVQESNNFSMSQSVDGQVAYTIHAGKEIQHKNGKVTLHDVGIVLYGRKHDREDHISGAEFEYDQNAGVVEATGEVHIDLQSPGAETRPKTPANSHPDPDDDNIIHVKTHGLVFWQKMGLAATKQELEFQIKGIQGSAVGAEYSSDTGQLVLESQVKAAGLANGKPVQLAASRAELQHNGQKAILKQAYYTSKGEGQQTTAASADDAIVLMRQDGSPEHVDASGNVTLEKDSGYTLHSTKMTMDLNEKGNPTVVHAFDGMNYIEDEPLRKGDGTATDGQMWFDAEGRPQRMVTTGSVKLTERVRTTDADPWTTRTVNANEARAQFAPIQDTKQSQLSEVWANGNARMTFQSIDTSRKPAAGKSTAPVTTNTTMLADNMDTKLLGTPDGLGHLHGEGHSEMRQMTSDGGDEDNRGDAMDVTFHVPPQGSQHKAAATAPAAAANAKDPLGAVVSAVMQGHVQIADTPARRPVDTKPPETGHGVANRAEYEAAQNHVTLTGNAQWANEGTTFWSDRIVMDRATGDVEGLGAVKASMVKQGTPANGVAPPDVTHVVADRAHLFHAAQRAEFYGTNNGGKSNVPARLWQGGSQVEAPVLVLEQEQKEQNRLSAHGDGPGVQVHTVISDTPAPGANSGTKKKTTVVRVASHEMTYSDDQRQGVFTGDVRVEDADGVMTSERADVWLQPANAKPANSPPAKPAVSSPAKPAAGSADTLSGSVDHIIAVGNVKLTQPGRHGQGEKLVYTASDGKFVLTGTAAAAPTVTDQRGTTTGASLIFHSGDDSVVVSGEPAGEGVHTQTRVKQQARQQ